MVYKLSGSGCTSTYVGQTIRRLTTRIEEKKKADSSVGLCIAVLREIVQILIGNL